jgi:hypothetical protein
MIEAAWAALLLLGVGAITATQLVPWAQLLEAGQTLMLASSAVGIPLEVVYFVLLAIALRAHGPAPAGWYWRSFDHHGQLDARQRRWVLPWFYVGALAFVGVALGIALVLLAFVAAWRQG